MRQKQSITIVGCGTAGVAVFLQLTNKLISLQNKDVSITIIEKKNKLGPGTAYSPYYDDNILNSDYKLLSILPSNPNHISEWMSENKEKLKKKYPAFNPENDPFPPRSLYGIYLKDTLSDSLERAKNFGIECRIIKGSVVDIKNFNEKIKIVLEDQDQILTDKVVLCLGHYPPTTYQELGVREGYFSWFWPDKKTVSQIPGNVTVGVLGTRLTAIDISTTLLSKRKDLKVILTSRGGLLPKVKSVSINETYKNALNSEVEKLITKKGALHLDDLILLMKNEIEKVQKEKIDWTEILSPKISALEILKRDIDDAKADKSSGWHSILASTTDIVENFWHKLSDKDKERFLRDYDGIWFIHRFAMPLKNAEKIKGYLESGRLKIYSGVKAVSYDETLSNFILSFGDKDIKVPVLINATNAGLDVTKIDSALIKNLLRSGLVTPNKFGGINVDFETCGTVNSHEIISKKIYLIGYLTRGVHFYTNDVTRIAEHARRVVDSITENKSWLQKIFSRTDLKNTSTK